MASAPDEASVLDYLLGFMTARQRRRMNRRMAADTRLRAAIEEWDGRLHPLNALAKPVTPPDEVWQAIQAGIAAPDRSGANRGWVWTVGGGVGAATAAAALAFWMWQGPVYRTDLRPTSPQGATTHLASVRSDRNDDLIVTVDEMPPPPAGKSFELWIIPAGGAPRSLGVMPQARLIKVHAGTLPEHATLAVSVEPLGGSPSGLPSGPVVASGELRRA